MMIYYIIKTQDNQWWRFIANQIHKIPMVEMWILRQRHARSLVKKKEYAPCAIWTPTRNALIGSIFLSAKTLICT
jgi:expansin (peptidoglycan-binding protein)